MTFSDMGRVIMSKNNPVGISHQQIDNITLLCRFCEQLLELEDAITKGLAPPEGSTVRTTATTFAAFAREVVAPAYRQAAGASS